MSQWKTHRCIILSLSTYDWASAGAEGQGQTASRVVVRKASNTQGCCQPHADSPKRGLGSTNYTHHLTGLPAHG